MLGRNPSVNFIWKSSNQLCMIDLVKCSTGEMCGGWSAFHGLPYKAAVSSIDMISGETFTFTSSPSLARGWCLYLDTAQKQWYFHKSVSHNNPLTVTPTTLLSSFAFRRLSGVGRLTMSTSSLSHPISRKASCKDGPQNFHRGRNIKSCLECRRRKMRCSRSQPCQNCIRFSRECQYFSSPKVPSSSFGCSRDGRPTKSGEKDTPTQCDAPAEVLWGEQELRSSTSLLTPNIKIDPIVRRYDPYNTGVEHHEGTEELKLGRLRFTSSICGLSRPQLARRVRAL